MIAKTKTDLLTPYHVILSFCYRYKSRQIFIFCGNYFALPAQHFLHRLNHYQMYTQIFISAQGLLILSMILENLVILHHGLKNFDKPHCLIFCLFLSSGRTNRNHLQNLNYQRGPVSDMTFEQQALTTFSQRLDSYQSFIK